MKIKNVSIISGKEHEIEIPMSEEDFKAAYQAWHDGMKIQHAFPKLTADQREFIMTGITAEEWAAKFPENPEDTDIPLDQVEMVDFYPTNDEGRG